MKTVNRKTKLKDWETTKDDELDEKVLINANRNDAEYVLPSFEDLIGMDEKLDDARRTIKVNKNYMLRSGFRSYSP